MSAKSNVNVIHSYKKGVENFLGDISPEIGNTLNVGYTISNHLRPEKKYSHLQIMVTVKVWLMERNQTKKNGGNFFQRRNFVFRFFGKVYGVSGMKTNVLK